MSGNFHFIVTHQTSNFFLNSGPTDLLSPTIFQYMDKPPAGKHSTKGLGKKVPQQSEHVKWRDDVVVPCGKPVPSNVKASELMYNEYIVYNTAQVSSKFYSCLLAYPFQHLCRKYCDTIFYLTLEDRSLRRFFFWLGGEGEVF